MRYWPAATLRLCATSRLASPHRRRSRHTVRRLGESHLLQNEDASNSEAARSIVCTGEFLAAFRAELSPDESRPERTALAPISPNVTVPTSDGKREVPKEGSQHRRDPGLSEFRYKRVTEEQECYSDPNPSPRPHPRPHASPSA